MSSENVELVRRAFMAWQAGAIEQLDELLANDVVWRPSALSGTDQLVFHGVSGVHDWISEVISRGGEVRNELDEIRDLGDRVLVMGRVYERRGEETVVDAELAWLFEIRDGKIARGESFTSRADAFRAAGQSG
jgi:ketosteroid isomerase-like protein